MLTTSSFGTTSKVSNCTHTHDLPQDSTQFGSAMLPVFLNDLRRSSHNDLVELTLELAQDDSIVVCSVGSAAAAGGGNSRSSSSRFRRKFSWLRSSTSSRGSSRASSEGGGGGDEDITATLSARDEMKLKAKLVRSTSSAQRALGGLRFISKAAGARDSEELWRNVESRFESLAVEGLLTREDFGECIGMSDSKEFALGVFDALARRRGQKARMITREELHEFWLQISNQSFDARLQIFFDMADSNEDGRITRDEVQELIMLSASANNLSKLKERAEEYASLIMEELDPENLGYIEFWQLEALLLQRENYMSYSQTMSIASAGWSQNISTKSNFIRTINALRFQIGKLNRVALENWQRSFIVISWLFAMTMLFGWKFCQYKHKDAFQVMGYCLPASKGFAETLKLNMALVLLPVCRNTLTWLRSTRARFFIPFDDNINFHKMFACAIAIGIIFHAGLHLACDFPRLAASSPEIFALIAADFHGVKPTYTDLVTNIESVTGITMVILATIAFTLATRHLRRNLVELPPPFNRLTGFNAFWFSHHLFALVYILLLVHGNFVFLVQKWHQKTTWMYIAAPLFLYVAERSLRTRRSEHYLVKILKVSVLPGDVFSLVMSKPNGFKYKSGQYIFLQCPKISPFEWHPFSITSAPGDDYVSVHIRTVGDWTQELKRVFTEDSSSASVIGRAKFTQLGNNVHQDGLPKLHVDGPYGAPAQEYQNYDVLLLVGLGIGATPFISILRDLLNNTRTEDQTDSNTETSGSDDSINSLTSTSVSAPSEKKKPQRIKSAHFYWVTREPGSFEWFEGVMNEVAELDHKGQIDMHNYLTSVYEDGDARSTLITMVQALNHAKHGVDILSGTKVRTHFARPNWKEVFTKIAAKNPLTTIGVFYCGMPVLAKELKQLSQELTHKTSTRFEFHKEYF